MARLVAKSIYTKALDLTAAITASQRLSANRSSAAKKWKTILSATLRNRSSSVHRAGGLHKRSAHAGIHEPRIHGENAGDRLHVVYSRSRQTLWNKGATSGHTQKVISMYADCDDDTLLVKVVQTGAACHTGSHSCFYKEIARN